jgi:site-specific DNA-methyltransferase (adenine-specific)
MKVTDKITITNEDNMLLMSRYPDNYFDLAIVDPPYGIGISSNPIRQQHKKKNWDDEIPLEKYFNELKRVSKNYIIWGGNYFIDYLNNSQGFIIWDKKQPENFSLAMAEFAYSSIQSPAKIFRYSVLTEQNKIHPTQKPVALYKWILDKYAKIKCDHKHEEHYRYLCTDCNNGNVKILDTHLGSGSIAIACHDYGFELTACELDKEYYDKAIQRIKNHTNQQKLF